MPAQREAIPENAGGGRGREKGRTEKRQTQKTRRERNCVQEPGAGNTEKGTGNSV